VTVLPLARIQTNLAALAQGQIAPGTVLGDA